jgi:hypothetical protein
VARVRSEVGDTSEERTTAVVEGLIARSYYALALGQDERAEGYKLLARKVAEHYASKTNDHGRNVRTPLPPFDVMNRTVLNDLLNTQKPVLPYEARAILRSQLGLAAESNAPPAALVSNSPPPLIGTNAAENVPTNSAAK